MKVVIVSDPPVSEEDYLRVNRSREKRFAFDRVFDKDSNQQEVFDEAACKVLNQ